MDQLRQQPKLHKFEIVITMHDGSTGTAWGLYATDWDAIDSALTNFADAASVTARRLK